MGRCVCPNNILFLPVCWGAIGGKQPLSGSSECKEDAAALPRRVSGPHNDLLNDGGTALWLVIGAQRQLQRSLFVSGDAERLHLAVEVGALQTEGLGGAADVAVATVQFFENIVALIGFAGLLQRGELLPRQAASA